jgi:hypothetical protein
MRQVLALAVVALAASGCDLEKRLEARKVLAGILLESPSASVTGGPTVQSVTSVSVFFAERQDGGATTTAPKDEPPPTGVSGAVVTLVWTDSSGSHGVAIPAVAGSPGSYAADSIGTQGLQHAYTAGVQYTFKVRYQDLDYTAKVTAPAAAQIVELEGTSPPKTVMHTWADFDDPYVVHRDIPTSVTDVDIGFYAVEPLSGATTQLGPDSATCQNYPKNDAQSLLQLAFAPSPWKQRSFSLPKATCFPSAGQYALSVTTVKKSAQADVSDNLFLGSVVLAGSGDAGAIILN